LNLAAGARELCMYICLCMHVLNIGHLNINSYLKPAMTSDYFICGSEITRVV